MTRFLVQDPHQEIGPLLRAAHRKGVLVETKGRRRYAVLPLTDKVMDFLLETDPRFIAECERARKDARAGKYKTLAEVKKMFGLK